MTVKILPLNSKEYEIPVNSITVNNKPSDTDLVFDREKITVRILGTEEALENLKEAQIALSIDLKSGWIYLSGYGESKIKTGESRRDYDGIVDFERRFTITEAGSEKHGKPESKSK